MQKNEDGLQNLVDAGSDIMRSVNRALETGNFNNLSSDIMHSVNQVTKKSDNSRASTRTTTTGRTTTKTNSYQNGNTTYSNTTTSYRQTTRSGNGSYYQQTGGNPQTPYATPNQNYNRYQGQFSTTTSQRLGRTAQGQSQNASFHQNNAGTAMTPFVQRSISRNAGIGKMVLGGIGTAFWGIFFLIFVLAAAIDFDAPTVVMMILSGAATVANGILLRKGLRQQKITRTFFQYASAIGSRAYIELKELAGIVYSSTEQVRKNLKEMIRLGYTPQARLDDKENTLMLTEEVYQQYLTTQQNLIEQEKEKAAKLAKEQSMSPEERNVAEMIEEGQAYIRKIREANNAIPDDVMTGKLNRLERIMRRIFEEVEKRPETAADLRRLMDYYLPTTEKLLNAYIALDAQPVKGENIAKTKKQIEDVLDTMNDAFEKLLDSMFEDMAWDVSSDISVMNTLLRQDGLTEDGMHS